MKTASGQSCPIRRPAGPRGSRIRQSTALLLFALLATLTAPFAGAADAKNDEPIELPPMIVSDSTGHHPWRYVAGAGLEVLSRCDDETTRDLVERNDRLKQLLDYVLAPELQFHTTAPRLILLVDSGMAPSLSQNLVARLDAGKTGKPAGDGADRRGPDAASQVRMLPNLQLADADLVAVFAIIDRAAFDADHLTYAPEHILQLLSPRTPPLPAWFIAGFLRLYRDVRFGTTDITIAPFTWVSDADTRALASDPDAPRRLMPLRDFFAFTPTAADPRLEQWRSQAALFIRWALETEAPERRAALGRFVAAVAQRGASDALCRECLHLGFSDLRDRLSDYLPVAIKAPIQLEPPALRHPPKLKVRNATAAEVARIKGEWERLEVRFVAARSPQYVDQYVALARQTLTTGLAAAPHDAGVLAARGLLEADRGDAKAARPFLEAAAMAGPVRPRVYVELAKFRLSDVLADAAQGAFTIGRAQVVLHPLQRALALDPPLDGEYSLTAEVWARCNAVPNATQWAFLADGCQRFPRDAGLLTYSAVLSGDRGEYDTAVEWINRAILLTPPAGRGQLLSIRAAILQAKQQARTASAPKAIAAPTPASPP